MKQMVAGSLEKEPPAQKEPQMKTKLFDSTVIREAQDVMDFMANVLEASTEYSIVQR